MNWIDGNSRVNAGVTVGSGKINRIVFADGLALLTSFERGLQYCRYLIGFLLRATKPEENRQ